MERVFLGALFLSVLAFWPWNWLGFTLPKMLILSLGLAIFFLAWSWKGETMRRGGRELWPVGAYFTLLFLSTLLSSAPLSSFLGASGGQWGLLTQLLYLGIFLGALTFPFKTWSKTLLWLNLIVSGYALLQFFGLDPWQSFWQEEAFLNRSFSVLGHPNWLASFLVLTFPVGLYYQRFPVGARLIAPLQQGGFIVLNLLALLTTASKAGFLAALFLAFVMLPGKSKHGKKLGVALGILMGLGLGYFYRGGWALTRSLGSRVHLWSGAGKAFLAQPWGYGLDTFWATFPAFSGPELWQTEPLSTLITHPHTLILEKLVELGPWGLAIFAGMTFVPLQKAWKKTDEKQCIAQGLSAYLITLLFGFETIGTGVIFWLFLGSLFYKEINSARPPPFWQRMATGGLGLIFLGFSLIHLQHARANAFYERGRAEINQNPAEALMNFEQAISLYPYDRVYLLQSTELLLALKNREERYLTLAQAHLNQLQNISRGKDPQLPIFQAWLAAKQGDFERVHKELEKAFLIYPSSGDNYKIAFQIYQLLDWQKEYETLKEKFYHALPEYWNEPETTPGRIFQKTHPWVENL